MSALMRISQHFSKNAKSMVISVIGITFFFIGLHFIFKMMQLIFVFETSIVLYIYQTAIILCAHIM